ncbi:hypothetical protein [Bradyrhizobium genosp. P]|uniref:hypothetical protein n=1 Tax=Bradyrhizobium genosp. P TaxID=83641 RepID=UPI003CE7D392
MSLAFLPQDGLRELLVLHKRAGEVALVAKIGRCRDFRQVQFRVRKQRLGLLDSSFPQPAARRRRASQLCGPPPAAALHPFSTEIMVLGSIAAGSTCTLLHAEQEGDMPESVYKVIELIGTSSESSE